MRKLSLYLIFLFLTPLLFHSCGSNPILSSRAKKETNTFHKEWEEIDSLELLGLSKKALERSNFILGSAIEHKNSSQIFKALAFRSKYINQLEENSEITILNDFEKYISESDSPSKQLLHSAIAEVYNQYYLKNQWKVNQRTYVESGKDIEAFDKKKLEKLIRFHYLKSLDIDPNLKTASISELKEVFTKEITAYEKNLRPSLYDFLSYRALEYFRTNGTTIPSLIEINIVSPLLIDAENNDLSNDDISYFIYNKLVDFHKNDKMQWAYVHAKLNQIEFLKSHAIDFNYRDSLYFFINQLEEEELKNEVRIELIKDYYNQGIGNHSILSNKTNSMALKKANQLIKLVQNSKSTTFQDSLIEVLQFNIQKPSFRVLLKNTYTTNEEVTIKVDYRNLHELEFYILNLQKADLKNLGDNKTDIIDWIERNKVITSRTITLPKIEHFNSTTAEFPLFKLPFGNYLLLVKDKNELKESDFYLAEFNISNLAVQTQHLYNKGMQFFVSSRNNGKAIKDVEITVKENIRNETQNSNSKSYKAKTDFNGTASFQNLEYNKSYTYAISYGKDYIGFKENYFYYRTSPIKEDRKQTYFFTDRSIYKSGQKVYFKGIQTVESGRKSTLGLNNRTDVFLIDPNGKYLDTLNLLSNNYGSYHGSFTLPKQSLNGNYRIATKEGQCYFQLTNYKRPSFKIVHTDSLIYSDSAILAKGKTLAFSGEAERNVGIDYRIFISNNGPRPYYNHYYFPFFNERILIANGRANSDKDGNYQLNIPLKSFKKDVNFSYEIDLIASNQRGETITKSYHLNTKKTTNVSMNILSSILKDGALERNELDNLIINSVNNNGEKVERKLLLKLWKLESKKGSSLTKKWTPAEYYMIENSFIRRKGNLDEKYTRIQLISESAINCNRSLNLFNQLDEGVYQIELKDPKDSLFEIKKNFYLYNIEETTFKKSDFLWISELNADLKIKEEVELLIGSSQDSAFILYDIDYKGSVIESGKVELSKSKKIFKYWPKIDIEEGFQIHFYLTHSNHFEKKTIHIAAPKQSELEIKLLSFRDKTKPSQNERYAFQILKKGNVATAEVMAAMYDASLDQFKNHQWNFDPQRKYYPTVIRNSDNSFHLTYPIAFLNRANHQKNIPHRNFSKLNWFGFSIHSGYHPYLATMDGAVLESKNNQTFKLSGSEEESRDDVGLNQEKEYKTASSFPLRSDFRETAFFYPQLKTNSKGEVQFEFEVPESLTEWKLMLLAHSKKLEYKYLEKRVISQKELMVKVNAPTFLRSEDKAIIKAEIVNLSDEEQVVQSAFTIFDSNNKKIVEGKRQSIIVPAKSSKPIQLKLVVPKGIPFLDYHIIASTNTHQDGERNSIVVVPREEIITKSFPFTVSENESNSHIFKEFQFDFKTNLDDLVPLNYTVEYSSNQWDRILESLHHIVLQNANNPIQFSEKIIAIQLFDLVLKKHPNLRESLLKKYSKVKPSTLESNPELKNLLVNETPWAVIANTATTNNYELKKLLDQSYLDSIQSISEEYLLELQLADGSWPWYKGMNSSKFISNNIVFLFSQIENFDRISLSAKLKKSLKKTIVYLDLELSKEYQILLEDSIDLNSIKVSHSDLSYLYSRSYFDTSIEDDFLSFYLSKGMENWQELDISMKARLGELLLKIGIEEETVLRIYASIKEFIIEDESKGAYWKSTSSNGHSFYSENLSQHVLASNFLNHVSPEDPIQKELDKWLFFQKKNTRWGPTNTSTLLAACKLIERPNPLERSPTFSRIRISDRLDTTVFDNQNLKVNWINKDISEDLAYLNISSNKKEISFGAIYWQSLQDNSLITSKNDQLYIERSFYKEVSSKGEIKLVPIDSIPLYVGDKLVARLKITAKSKQQFVHLTLGNSASSITTDAISAYQFQDNLAFYKEVEMSRINFFFNQIEKGVYIIETPFLLNQSGTYESGNCSIQSQYSPEIISTVPSKLLIIKGN